MEKRKRNLNIPVDLTRLFKKNLRVIMKATGITQADIGDAIGLSRQSVNAILHRNDDQMTLIHFLSIKYALTKLIGEFDGDERIKKLAMSYLGDIEQAFCSFAFQPRNNQGL